MDFLTHSISRLKYCDITKIPNVCILCLYYITTFYLPAFNLKILYRALELEKSTLYIRKYWFAEAKMHNNVDFSMYVDVYIVRTDESLTDFNHCRVQYRKERKRI
jgi:hypothetical protein